MSIFTCRNTYRVCFMSIFTCRNTSWYVLCRYSLAEIHPSMFYVDIHLQKYILSMVCVDIHLQKYISCMVCVNIHLQKDIIFGFYVCRMACKQGRVNRIDRNMRIRGVGIVRLHDMKCFEFAGHVSTMDERRGYRLIS